MSRDNEGGITWPAFRRMEGRGFRHLGGFLTKTGTVALGVFGYEAAENFSHPLVAGIAGAAAAAGFFGQRIHDAGTLRAVQAVMEMHANAPVTQEEL